MDLNEQKKKTNVDIRLISIEFLTNKNTNLKENVSSSCISSTDILTWWHRMYMCFCILVSIITIFWANNVHRWVEILFIARVFDSRSFTFAFNCNWFTPQQIRPATLAITNDTKVNACKREKKASLILLHFSFNGSQLHHIQMMLCPPQTEIFCDSNTIHSIQRSYQLNASHQQTVISKGSHECMMIHGYFYIFSSITWNVSQSSIECIENDQIQVSHRKNRKKCASEIVPIL